MASITTEPNGRRSIQFVALDGNRLRIRLGKVSERYAQTTKDAIEELLAAKREARATSRHISRWVVEVNEQDPKLARKLARVGLIETPAETATVTLRHFLDSYIAGRADLKSATKVVRGLVIRDLTAYFGEECDVRSIMPGNADDFKQWLVGRKLAPTTIHKRLQVARSFFRAMRRRKLIEENPFDGVNVAAAGIQDRQRFVTREETARVLAACPNHTWRTIVALARFGGLRTPSETLSLRWADIDWDAGRIVVTSPKTEHHAGKASRTIPFFPELRPILSEAFDLAPDGAEYVVDEKYRKAAMGPAGWANANLRTALLKIIRRAGLQPWPRLFHNLRASRETELVEAYPVQVVTSWLGNTPSIAMRHYLMTTDAHFAAALTEDEAKQKAAHNPAQQAPATGCGDTQPVLAAHKKPPVLPGLAGGCKLAQLPKVAGAGLEPATHGL